MYAGASLAGQAETAAEPVDPGGVVSAEPDNLRPGSLPEGHRDGGGRADQHGDKSHVQVVKHEKRDGGHLRDRLSAEAATSDLAVGQQLLEKEAR
jgi:hypothetical protein